MKKELQAANLIFGVVLGILDCGKIVKTNRL